MEKVAICAIVKDERRYLAEWIAYHSVIGFDHFFLYDNGSSDTTLAILRRARERGICTSGDVLISQIEPAAHRIQPWCEAGWRIRMDSVSGCRRVRES